MSQITENKRMNDQTCHSLFLFEWTSAFEVYGCGYIGGSENQTTLTLIVKSLW